jgi:hypothetical protein
MLRFNTSFLFAATVIIALCCLPMALNQASGFVWTAFLLPMSLGLLAAMQVEEQSEFEFNFRMLPNSVVEISTSGGPHHQWLMRGRIATAGLCLSVVVGLPMLHLVDPEPPATRLPIVALFALIAAVLLGSSMRRRVLTEERQIVTEYLLFGWRCWRRRPWQVRDGDYLTVLAGAETPGKSTLEFRGFHVLLACRGRQRETLAFCVTMSEQVIPGMEFAGQLIAQLVAIPYEGYQFKKFPSPRLDSANVSTGARPVLRAP